MDLYRVFPFVRGARRGRPGHPMYLHTPQGAGRLDNPDHYLVRYIAHDPAAAVAEVFAGLTRWTSAMFAVPALSGASRALARYALPDDVALLDLDDARALLDRGLRPTQVVTRDRAKTQPWALRIFREARGWAGVRWWSYHRPEWPVLGLWADAGLRVDEVEALTLAHPAVAEAADALARELLG